MKSDPKNIITWLLIIVVPIIAVILMSGILHYTEPGLFIENLDARKIQFH